MKVSTPTKAKTMHDQTKTIERRQAIDDATTQRIGELLHKARNTTDPLEMLDIKAEMEKYDPTANIDALLVTTDFIEGAKAPDMKAVTAKRNKADKAVADKRSEIANTIARLNTELDSCMADYQAATADMAIATVNHNRFEALRTGIASEGAYAAYARPAVRAWAKHAGIIKD